VINGVFRATIADDVLANAIRLCAEESINEMPDALVDLPRTVVPLWPGGVLGVESLRTLGTTQPAETVVPIASTTSAETVDEVLACSTLTSLGTLIDDLAAVGHGVILAMGKGGVGKTTVAAAIAMALAERGLAVHLSTTDPAAHITATIAGDELPNLTIDRIDPVAETASYSKEVMANAGKGLDKAGLALLEEDLRSPCTEEIAVFRAFAKAVAKGQDRLVVLDTAPTGHTILLLDSALAYHREVLRQSSQMPAAVKELLPRLRDPEFTRVLIVTLPEATPVHEAARLQDDLRRADIAPYAWVINRSLTPLTLTDPVLQSQRRHELPFIREVIEQHATRTVIIPWQAESPTGREGLSRLAADCL
jgi:arsenite-transporting ATPase